MTVFSRYDAVKTDTGEPVGVADAIQLAADAVADWRVNQLAKQGLADVDAYSRFILLCWDVLQAGEFRFNEAMLLGRAVGIDISNLRRAGLVESKGDKVRLLPARERRREKALAADTDQLTFLENTSRRGGKSAKIHPNDPQFFTAIDACHALALRYLESGEGDKGIGAAKGMARQQGWTANSPVARLMEALLLAAPEGVRFPGKKGKKTAADTYPEFRVWHTLLQPLFGISPPPWKEKEPPLMLDLRTDEEWEQGNNDEA